VLDADRRPVRGLTATDFTVFEEGTPREIVAFTPVDLPHPVGPDTTSAATWAADIAPDVATNEVPTEGRLVVIAFDWSIRFQDSPLARRIATETVKHLGPGDQAAVVFTSSFATAGVPQNFTADRQRLLAAIEQPMAFAMQGLDVILPTSGGFINQNGVMLEDPGGYASGECRCRVCSLEAMTRIANTMRPVTGRRKLMIFIGTHFRGYESPLPVPRQPMRGLPPPPGTLTQFLIPESQGAGTCSAPLRDARRDMERAAALANMTIHVMDPVGLETLESSPLGGASPDTVRTRLDGLHLPADLTGGRTVVGTNAPEAALPDIFAESQSYYLLGFLAADGADSARLRRIEVKVNRPAVQVRARSGYVGREEAAARGATAVSPSLLQSVEGTLPRTEVPLALVAAPFRGAGNRTGSVALVLRLESPTETGVERRPAAGPPARHTMRVAIAALDPKARLVATREQTVEFTPAPNVADQPRAYELLSRLELSPGRYEVRAGVDAGTGARGSVFTFVDVPDFLNAPFSASGISVSAHPASPIAPADLFADLMPATPTARRVFTRTDHATAFMQIHQAADAAVPVTVLSRILDRAGRVVFEDTRAFGADRFGGGQTADYQVSLPLSRLEVSDYLLAVQASTPSHELRRHVRFTVQ
jgi:VWFA-related protein